ncbi:CPBP family intramembrane glutamic endopeptidase [Knoellia aerolata]|uniref:Abortive phage infection protein n=1 Tax=Knoellia aerolata DSM 18566 TaxID=1385519 RepID=A0A0A0JSR1_9MICO|nr:type II CAAX endopeptidase family protein [Knoellia aerolata]KGN40213.1 abortive phage infection protein [Knoellia aerolata DSM 18566]
MTQRTHHTVPAVRAHASATPNQLRQYTLSSHILAIWTAAALPMAVLAWVVAPWLADSFDGPAALPRAIILVLTVGLVWQFVLVVLLVRREQGTLRWPIVKEALWLRAPISQDTGRRGGVLWLILVPLMVLFAAKEFLPTLPAPAARDMAVLLDSDAGQSFLSGNWLWFGLIVMMYVFNTALGEELLFRGLLLPRMQGTFGRWDWVANGVLFGLYHLHVPWSIPRNLVDTFILCYPSRRYQSALIGIIVHSAQSLFFVVLVLVAVLS